MSLLLVLRGKFLLPDQSLLGVDEVDIRMRTQINLVVSCRLRIYFILVHDVLVRLTILLDYVAGEFQALNHPIIELFVVHGEHLHAFQLLSWDEVLQDELLQLDFLLNLSSSFLEFLDFTTIKLIQFFVLILDLLQALHQTLYALGLVINLILLGVVLSLQLHHLILTLLEFLGLLLYVNLLLLQLLHGIIELFLLDHGHLNFRLALNDLLLHLLDLLDEFLLSISLNLLLFLLLLQGLYDVS